MKDREDWITLALGETPPKGRMALDVYFEDAQKTDDLLGFLLREGFKLCEDKQSRGP